MRWFLFSLAMVGCFVVGDSLLPDNRLPLFAGVMGAFGLVVWYRQRRNSTATNSRLIGGADYADHHARHVRAVVRHVRKYVARRVPDAGSDVCDLVRPSHSSRRGRVVAHAEATPVSWEIEMVRYLGLMAALYLLWMGADIVLDQSAPLVLRIIGLVISGGFVALLVRWYRPRGREQHRA